MTKMTQAQVRFIDHMLAQAGKTSCRDIGEQAARAACIRHGWIERDRVQDGIVLYRLSEAGRVALNELAYANIAAEI